MCADKFHEEFVMMPIPVGAVSAVYELLGRYSQAKTGPERVSVPGNADWTEAEVRALHGKLRNEAAKAAFRRIAAARGEWVTYAQMAKAAGLEIDNLRPHLAWFSKYAKQVKGENYWPLEHVENASQPKGEHAQYRMPPRIAQWWLDADRDADGGGSTEED